jgi:hypothetical protein
MMLSKILKNEISQSVRAINGNIKRDPMRMEDWRQAAVFQRFEATG